MFTEALFLWLVAGLTSHIRAQCTQEFFNIDSVEAANAVRDCTVLSGQVQIDLANTNGSFHLDNVQQIEGHLLIQTYGEYSKVSNSGDEWQGVSLSLSSLREVTGRLEASGTANIVSISLPALATVSQIVYLHNLPNLETVSLPALDKVAAFELNTLPALRNLEIDAGISDITGYEDLVNDLIDSTDPYAIIESTALAKLESFNFSTLAIFQITNNPNLESIVLPIKETKKAKSWELTTNKISGNGNSNTTLSFPHLFKLETQFTELRDLSYIDVPRLGRIEGSLLIGDNKLMTTFNASRLKEVSNDLTIEWNPKLSSVTFPVLRTVNYLIAQGTKALEKSDGLSMADLRAVKEVYIGGDGSRVNCQLWDNKRCTGLVTTVYSCGSNWRHLRHVDVARNKDECRFTHPSHGWTRAKKIRVSFRVVMAVAILAAVLSTFLHYRHTLWSVDYRCAFQNAMAGKYFLANEEDEEETVEFDVRDFGCGDAEQAHSRSKPLPQKPLPAFPS